MLAPSLQGAPGHKILRALAGRGVKQHGFTNLIYKSKLFQDICVLCTKKSQRMAKKTGNETDALAMVAIKGAQEKKAHEIVLLDLRKLKGAFADMMVVCHGNSDRQVEAIADGVEEEIRMATGEKPLHREGGERAEWILLDYVNVVVHVFLEEKRRFYGIEDLWGDAELKKFDEPV